MNVDWILLELYILMDRFIKVSLAGTFIFDELIVCMEARRFLL